MPGSTMQDGGAPEVLADDELSALALAADPDIEVDDDAMSLWELTGAEPTPLLPDWYMPSPMGVVGPVAGWRRSVIVIVVLAFLAITAAGLCNTYGQFAFG